MCAHRPPAPAAAPVPARLQPRTDAEETPSRGGAALRGADIDNTAVRGGTRNGHGGHGAERRDRLHGGVRSARAVQWSGAVVVFQSRALASLLPLSPSVLRRAAHSHGCVLTMGPTDLCEQRARRSGDTVAQRSPSQPCPGAGCPQAQPSHESLQRCSQRGLLRHSLLAWSEGISAVCTREAERELEELLMKLKFGINV